MIEACHSIIILGSRTISIIRLLLFNYGLLKRRRLWLVIVFIRVIINSWRLNREVRDLFILVTISNIDLLDSAVLIEVVSTWPLERADDDNTVADFLAAFS